MSKINCVVLGGYATEPEMRYTGTGTPVTSFKINIGGDKYKGSDGEERKTDDNWVKIVSWNKAAEMVNQYLKKGAIVTVTAKLQPAEGWTAQDGKVRAGNVVRMDQIMFKNKDGEDVAVQSAPGDYSQGLPEDDDIPF
jgi:single-strand DNA-binding protein